MMLGACINRPSFLYITLEPGCAPLLPNLPRLPLPGTSNLETRPVQQIIENNNINRPFLALLSTEN